MNGLRYHYQHSGDHGAIGLALLASGQHECLQHAHGRSSAASSRHSTPATSGHSTPVTGHSTPTYAQQYQQQMLYTSAQQQYLRQQQALQAQVQISYPTVSTETVPVHIAQ
jgi:transcription factor SFP1